ncbi:hypothetical protein RBH29_04380 [Herbivorax sp. ANBcel31]|uniref:hypothetical protein n=1 Tax=Herbivorax sp. ANBcel31 TaxID=3069754 RepID=UPI0027B1F1A0|nr:hypothetical protein [Herbivorax sp. ANBcel31]MDQ2085670.1 hypothetical protein [Herbivorax sp. ANBcel31]
MKKIIIVILAILLAVFIGIILPILVNNNATGSSNMEDESEVESSEGQSVNTNKPDENQNSFGSEEKANGDDFYESKNEGNGSNKESEEVSIYDEGDGQYRENNQEGKDDAKDLNTSDDIQDDGTDNIRNSDSEDDKTSDDINDNSNEESEVLSESWVEEMIEEYNHHILDDDIEDLRRLYAQVDIAYLQGVIEGGYTEEDIEEVRAYLQETLGSDYARGRDLFYKYSYLMMEIEI